MQLISIDNCILEFVLADHFVKIYKDSEGKKSIESIINYNLSSHDLYSEMDIEGRKVWKDKIFSLDVVKNF